MDIFSQMFLRFKSVWFSVLFLFLYFGVVGQNNKLSGRVTSNGTPLIGASVAMENSSLGTITDLEGQFVLADIPKGEHTFNISYVGYKSISSTLIFQMDEIKKMDFNLDEDILGLEAVVVTATRNAIPAFLSPIIVNRLDDRIFDRTQSISLAEGLHFSPGLRIENNCQNCGFTQLRMNGLEGPYTQILINSRPVFSALAGVYGLEMIPTNMVERVEIVRGGGSALYGGNAIAGTVNIITKDPLFNHFEYNSNLAITNFENADKSLSVNGSLVSDQLDRGITFFGFNRSRNPWDANGDELSEMTKLNNLTLGADAYWKPSERSRLSWNLLFMKEFRRGGGDFDVQPHQASLAEQLNHDINGGGISYEYYSKDNSRKISVYSSLQQTNRGSYYGSGGSILTTGSNVGLPQLQAINAYGVSKDMALAAGWQISAELDGGFSLTAGNEWVHNKVSDRMPGYNRSINQTVNTFGTYAQLQWKPADSWTFLAGGRLDPLSIDGIYLLDNYDFSQIKRMAPFVPRFSVLKNLNSSLKLRVSYSQGYRAPQAFNEDLHIETVGGAALFTQLDQDLKTETSRSWNASFDYNWRKGSAEGNFIVDGFHITLSDPFILSDQIELPNGIGVVTKRNGSGARVFGLNFESNIAITRKWIIQGGATVQRALYDEREIIWSPGIVTESNKDSVVSTDRLLRTPNVYGFLSMDWRPVHEWSFSLSSVYTGSMQVKHIIDVDNEFPVWVNTRSFLEVNFKMSKEWHLHKTMPLTLSMGIQNIFNAYQKDFDRGVQRDAGYIYGPSRPRTIFFGISFAPFKPE